MRCTACGHTADEFIPIYSEIHSVNPTVVASLGLTLGAQSEYPQSVSIVACPGCLTLRLRENPRQTELRDEADTVSAKEVD